LAIKHNLPVNWDIRASDDLEDIFTSIHKDSLQNANHVVETLLDLADSLADFPEKYPVLELLKPSDRIYRFVPQWSFKLIYEVTESEIRVMMVFNARQDPARLQERL